VRDDATVLILLSGCLLTSCITAARKREARCLDRDVPSFDIEHAALRRERQRNSSTGKDDTLYRRVVAAHARHGEAIEWHRLVAGRVQTRIEEDEMLYPVLGMLATSTALCCTP
jgi:hypothetical protein